MQGPGDRRRRYYVGFIRAAVFLGFLWLQLGHPSFASGAAQQPVREATDAEKRGNYDRAIAIYTEALRLHPKTSGYYVNRGIAHHHKGEGPHY